MSESNRRTWFQAAAGSVAAAVAPAAPAKAEEKPNPARDVITQAEIENWHRMYAMADHMAISFRLRLDAGAVVQRGPVYMFSQNAVDPGCWDPEDDIPGDYWPFDYGLDVGKWDDIVAREKRLRRIVAERDARKAAHPA